MAIRQAMHKVFASLKLWEAPGRDTNRRANRKTVMNEVAGSLH